MLTFEFYRLGDPCTVQTKNTTRMRNYRQDIRRGATARWPSEVSPITVPVRVTLSYFYTQDIMDVDNIIKPVLDELKGLVYVDDKQVVSVTSRKINVLSPEAVVAVTSFVLISAFRSRSDFLHILVEWE